MYLRRFKKGKALTDVEVLEVWKGIFKKHPIKPKLFYWEFAIAYCDVRSQSQGLSLVTRTDRVTEEFSNKISLGYPMSSFLIYKGTQKITSELTSRELQELEREQFLSFRNEFKIWLKKLP